MKRETISRALDALEDRFVTEAENYRPGAIQETPERIVRMRTKKLISIALAAALVLALGVLLCLVSRLFLCYVSLPAMNVPFTPKCTVYMCCMWEPQ